MVDPNQETGTISIQDAVGLLTTPLKFRIR